MRVLVSGAAGFVGHRLCHALANLGHDVIALVHPDSTERARRLIAASVSDIVACDLATLSAADLPRSADALITLGQARHFRDFPGKADETFSVNVVANLRLLQWAVSAGVRKIVHASSGGIHGRRNDGELRETDLVAVDSPAGFYLGSKLCSEIVLQNFRQFFETVVILRPFFIYGPQQRKDMFVARIIESVRNNVPVLLQGKDGLRVNPIFVEDAVQAFARAHDLRGCNICNIAGPDIVTLRQLSELIGAAVNLRPQYEVDMSQQPVDYVGTTAQAERLLGLSSTSLRQGLALTIASGSDAHA
jgi:UDP-glucose 4-epimerase